MITLQPPSKGGFCAVSKPRAYHKTLCNTYDFLGMNSPASQPGRSSKRGSGDKFKFLELLFKPMFVILALSIKRGKILIYQNRVSIYALKVSKPSRGYYTRRSATHFKLMRNTEKPCTSYTFGFFD